MGLSGLLRNSQRTDSLDVLLCFSTRLRQLTEYLARLLTNRAVVKAADPDANHCLILHAGPDVLDQLLRSVKRRLHLRVGCDVKPRGVKLIRTVRLQSLARTLLDIP